MKFELCAASVEAIDIATDLNFDRIELCQSLEQGGLTPSNGLIRYALDKEIETHVLIRPRAGGFSYSAEEKKIIIADVEECRRLGVKGVVIGGLTEFGEIDKELLQMIKGSAGDLKVTFHRAFDDSLEWKRSIDILIECGIDRVLTSGMASSVEIGMPALKQLNSYSNGRIEIMAGGGVNSSNIKKIFDEIKPDAIHFSGTVKSVLDEESLFSESLLKVDRNKILRILDQVKL
jgi:copper homeostasis protein